MKNFFIPLYALIILISGCTTHHPYRLENDALTQISTIDALLDGVYDGTITCDKLKNYGNLGLGTFNKLDGEMIMLDGNIYKASVDGHVYKAKHNWKTPFAAVTFFHTDLNFNIDKPKTFQQLKDEIDTHMDSDNIFYAIKITGTFKNMKIRSVPAQTKPYPPLKEVVKHQTVFSINKCKGTIVGFKCPPYVKGINVTGYHLHFISDDKKVGGHILALETDSVIVAVDSKNKFFLKLPDTNAFKKSNLKKDRSADLEKIEK